MSICGSSIIPRRNKSQKPSDPVYEIINTTNGHQNLNSHSLSIALERYLMERLTHLLPVFIPITIYSSRGIFLIFREVWKSVSVRYFSPVLDLHMHFHSQVHECEPVSFLSEILRERKFGDGITWSWLMIGHPYPSLSHPPWRSNMDSPSNRDGDVGCPGRAHNHYQIKTSCIHDSQGMHFESRYSYRIERLDNIRRPHANPCILQKFPLTP